MQGPVAVTCMFDNMARVAREGIGRKTLRSLEGVANSPKAESLPAANCPRICCGLLLLFNDFVKGYILI